MIIVKLIGRLGNQLFQYAFAISMQKRFGTYAVIDDRDQRDILSEYFSIRGIYRHKLIKKIIFRFHRFPTVYQDGGEDPSQFFSLNVKNHRYYSAYFQSEQYFKEIRDELKKRIRIKKSFQEAFQTKYGELFSKNKILAIHYRFGDYLHWDKEGLGGPPFTLPDRYYKNALAAIPDLDDHMVVLVTDDADLCDKETKHLKNKMIVSDSEIMDFQILLNADKLIIANSSFSWWAGYLNQKNAQVFAPEYWLGFKIGSEFPNAIIPEKYTRVRF